MSLVRFQLERLLMVWVGDAFDILWSILFTGLNTTYILAYHFGVYQISRDLWTLTLWLFLAKRNHRAIIMTAHTYIQKGNSHTIEPKWSILDCIRKPFMNPILGAFSFWIFVTRTNNNVACLIFFKCEWQRGSPPIWFGSHKKMNFYQMKTQGT